MADAEHARNDELTEHNRRVVAWKDAQDFSGIRADKAAALRNVMLLVGFSADKESGICTATVRWLAANSATRGHGVRPVTRGRLWDHIATLEKLGLLSVGHVKNGFADKSRGLGAVNSYTCEFSQVRVRSGDRSGDRSGVVSRELGFTREDQKQAIPPSARTGPDAETKPAGRGRVGFDYPAFRPSAAADKNPSVDARLTGSAELDSIKATFLDPVEQEMASEFVKALRRDYSAEQIVRASGAFLSGRKLSGIRDPRKYANSVAHEVREILEGWKKQEDCYRKIRRSMAAEARLNAAEAERRARETAEQTARGMVEIDVLSATDWDDPAAPDVPQWLPRSQAVQITNAGGQLVWIPRTETDTDSGKLTDGMEPGPGISIDELLGDGRHEDEPGTGRR